MRLKDKVAIITGGSSGMGRAAAELLAEKGVKVVIAGRRKAQGERIAESIRQGGGQSIFIQTDVAEAEQVENIVQHYFSLQTSRRLSRVQHFWWMAELVQSTDSQGTNCHLNTESNPQLS